MLNIPTTEDIKNELRELHKNGIFREGKYGKTVEIQNAHFLADKDWIIREPNYDYAKREINELLFTYEEYLLNPSAYKYPYSNKLEIISLPYWIK